MTERFTYDVNNNLIEEDGKFLAYLNVSNVHCITKRLNELYCEKEQLKNNDLEKENQQLRELLKLIADACSYTKEHSVKEILRLELKAIDTVTCESAEAYYEYCLLNNFFTEQYGEHWDNWED